MAASIRWSGGRLTYTGRLTDRTFSRWADSPEGQAAISREASRIRFSLIGRQRSARRRFWRDVCASARDGAVAAVIQEEANRYLSRLSELAFAEALPRVTVNLRRLVVVPRQLVNGVVRVKLSTRLKAMPAIVRLPDQGLRDFLYLALAADMDRAVVAAQPSSKRPLEAGVGWSTIGVNTTFVWFSAVEESEWAGHHFVFELPREPLTRAVRKTLVQAMESLDKSVGALSQLQRTEILRRSWPAELIR